MPFVKYRGANGEWIKLGGGNVRVSNGHTWIPPRARIWNGHEWLNLLEERKITTWTATWSEGYWGADHGNIAHTHYNSLWRHDRLAQGDYQPYHDRFNRSIEHGMAGFDDANIRAELAGARIEKVEIYLHSLHWAYMSGGTAVIGLHNARGWQERFSEVNHGVARVRYYRRDQGQWITLPNWVGDNLRDNLITGITTSADNNSLWQYGIFAGIWDGWKKPKIRITYWK